MMVRRRTAKPEPPAPPVLPETLHFVSAAVTILGQGGALGVRAIHFYVLAPSSDDARNAFLANMQGAPFAYQITDIIVTEIPHAILMELAQGQDSSREGSPVWH